MLNTENLQNKDENNLKTQTILMYFIHYSIFLHYIGQCLFIYQKSTARIGMFPLNFVAEFFIEHDITDIFPWG